MKDLIRSILLACLSFSAPTVFAAENPFIREYYLFQVPNISLVGPVYSSWFFMRSGFFWSEKFFLNLQTVDWPQWDTKQIPLKLVANPKSKTTILIFDEQKNFIESKSLASPFSPEEYAEKSGKNPAYYKVELSFDAERIVLTSDFYEWIRPKPIAKCELDIENREALLEKNKTLSTCVATLRAYLSESNENKQQFYVRIFWPKTIQGRENITYIKDIERDLRSMARKKNFIFIAEKTKDKTLRAQIGLTQKEKFPVIKGNPELLENREMAEFSPGKDTPKKTIFVKEIPSGAALKINAFYADQAALRAYQSPVMGNRQINLQFVNRLEASTNTILVTETRELEERTGIFGQLRSWQLLGFGSYKFLDSGRGESNSYLGMLGAEVRYNWEKYQIQPYLSAQRDFIHWGSSLFMSEIKFGVIKQTDWIPGGIYSLGFHQYTLAGRNPSSTRLGGLTGLSAGVGTIQYFEKWRVGGKVDLIYGNSLSVDSRLDCGKFFSGEKDSRIYTGMFLGYTRYRASVENKINIKELFSEDVVQIGFTYGWIGAD